MNERPDQWLELKNVAISVEDTEIGREIFIWDYSPPEVRADGDVSDPEWHPRYGMPAAEARNLYKLLGQIFPED